MARMRCGNMEELSRFWIADKKIKCIFCVVRDGALRRYLRQRRSEKNDRYPEKSKRR